MRQALRQDTKHGNSLLFRGLLTAVVCALAVVVSGVDSDPKPVLAAGSPIQANGWTKPSTMASAGAESSITVDGAGTWHLVYREYTGGVSYVRYRSSQGALATLDSRAAPGGVYDPTITIDNTGDIHVAYVHDDFAGGFDPTRTYEFRHAILTSGSWSAAPPLASLTVPSAEVRGQPSLAVASDGSWHLLYYAFHYAPSSLSIEYLSSTGASETIAAVAGAGLTGVISPSLALGPGDSLHATYKEIGTGIIYRTKAQAGPWSAPITIAPGASVSGGSIAADATGRWHLLYTAGQSQGDSVLTYVRYLSSDGLSAQLASAKIVYVEDEYGFPVESGYSVYSESMAMTPDGALHASIQRVFWDEGQPPEEAVLYTRQAVYISNAEFTQAIQELSPSLADLQTNGPAIDLIQGKPAALRVVFSQVDQQIPLVVEATGSSAGKKALFLQPGCDSQEQRRREAGCATADFYFTPGPNVTLTVELRAQDGSAIDRETFDFSTVQAEPILLSPISICDAQDGVSGEWLCPDRGAAWRLIPFLRAIAPTCCVVPVSTGRMVQIPLDPAYEIGWWTGVVRGLGIAWLLDGNPATNYYLGIVRGQASTTLGGAAIRQIPWGRAAASKEVVYPQYLVGGSPTSSGDDIADQALAHEVFHMLARRHVPSALPGPTDLDGDGDLDGCWAVGDHVDNTWPYATSSIDEVGFNIALREPIIPQKTSDVMSYCEPMWVSPYTYQGALAALLIPGGGAGRSGWREPAGEAAAQQSQLWLISGTIDGSTAAIDPILTIVAKEPSAAPTGSYRVDIEDSIGTVLSSHDFDAADIDAYGLSVQAFAQLVPVVPGAALVAVRDALDNTLASVVLGGAVPVVSITYPTSGATLDGIEELTWSVSDPDSSAHTFIVEYSPVGGAAWMPLGSSGSQTSLVVDFDQLPGSTNAVVRVSATDGANTGTAISSTFTVNGKLPQVQIISPIGGSSYELGDLVWLQGIAWDADDGYLAASAMQWSSDRDGFLGNGDDIHVTDLSDGDHVITLEAADTDGNVVSDAITLSVVAPETDGDGCPNQQELQTAQGSQTSGGLRDPFNQYDYFNPTHDGQNRVDDILAVVNQYHIDSGNPAYTSDTDRTSLGPNAWNLGPPNGQQRVDDILNAVYQYHHDCV